MIGLDTNALIPYLVQDEPDQPAVASTVIDALTENDPGFLSLVTIVGRVYREHWWTRLR